MPLTEDEWQRLDKLVRGIVTSSEQRLRRELRADIRESERRILKILAETIAGLRIVSTYQIPTDTTEDV